MDRDALVDLVASVMTSPFSTTSVDDGSRCERLLGRKVTFEVLPARPWPQEHGLFCLYKWPYTEKNESKVIATVMESTVHSTVVQP
jgi:hypothetical protein